MSLSSWNQKQSFQKASSPGSGARGAVPGSLQGLFPKTLPAALCVQAGAETVTSHRHSVTRPGTWARCHRRFISGATCQDLGCVQHRSWESRMRLCIKLLLFPKYLTATFLCSSYPLRPKVTKTLSPVWDCFSPQPGLGVLQSSQGNHFAATATPGHSTGEEQCGTFGTGRSSHGGNCALQISVISENDSK